MKPMLKPPGIKRLKLESDEPLSTFGFKIDLRRYTTAQALELAAGLKVSGDPVGRCRLTLSNPHSNRLELIA
jgi:hypothetical protein